MYLELITNEQLSAFISDYVKQYHINSMDCFEDACVYVDRIKKGLNGIEISTIIKDGTGFLEESWKFNNFKGYKDWCNSETESVELTKKWASFVYECIYSKNKKLASDYKRAYIEKLEQERELEISNAKSKFRERVF